MAKKQHYMANIDKPFTFCHRRAHSGKVCITTDVCKVTCKNCLKEIISNSIVVKMMAGIWFTRAIIAEDTLKELNHG